MTYYNLTNVADNTDYIRKVRNSNVGIQNFKNYQF